MSVASTLLRLLLMISLLLNGVNAAVAAPVAIAAADQAQGSTSTHRSADTDCHGLMASHAAPPAAVAPAAQDPCKIKSCLRSCAQQPALAVQPLLLTGLPARSAAPLPLPTGGLPTPPQLRINRPPIG